ncbi:hypothetical protein BBP40_004795, partial [Aspergillus hancockii]
MVVEPIRRHAVLHFTSFTSDYPPAAQRSIHCDLSEYLSQAPQSTPAAILFHMLFLLDRAIVAASLTVSNSSTQDEEDLQRGGLFGFDISSMSGVLGTSAYTNYFRVGSGQYKQGSITCAMPFGSLI